MTRHVTSVEDGEEISDYAELETIMKSTFNETATLDDVKKLKVRNFYWNEDYHPNKKEKNYKGKWFSHVSL